MNFKQLGISNDLVNTLNQMGIKNPTPIQEEAIPLIINKKDIIAPTTSEKPDMNVYNKAFFLLPVA